MINLEFTNKDLHKSIQDKVNEGFYEHEKSHGIYDEYEKFNIIAKLDKKVVGVLSGYTVFAEIYVDNFWIEKNHRKKGYGRKILLYLENKYKDSGYNNINLVTSAFQAPKFYENCGYDLEFVRKNIFNPKLSKYFYIKYFDNESQHKGIVKDSN